jgi:ABC-2 type transport system permease protein
MRNTWTIFKREMMAYFYSPIAYMVGSFVLVILGFFFVHHVYSLIRGTSQYTPMDLFFNIAPWIVVPMLAPLLTMRLFADDNRAGMIESLMTTPLRDMEYVLGKFLSALAFYLILWIPTLSNLFIIKNVLHEAVPLEMGRIMGGYLFLGLMGMFCLSIGCFASSLTRNQIIAAMISSTFGWLILLSGLWFYFNPSSPSTRLFEYISLLAHMEDFSRGIVRFERVVFYLSGTAVFLFLTHRVVESRRWRY